MDGTGGRAYRALLSSLTQTWIADTDSGVDIPVWFIALIAESEVVRAPRLIGRSITDSGTVNLGRIQGNELS
ncbi:MAG TPA: hypothetical protein DEV93_20390 [Chloroflexi bacterium]|jgi:hypothetical protein|nr:hypothetical protein [Chloroflexota bacterium]